MKKVLIAIPILLILIGIVYFNLPFEITRSADLNFGNKLVDKINEYRKENNKLPETDNWETLERLGFKMEMLGTKPFYEKINEKEFELIYLEGFDGPYLLYNSQKGKWAVDFPTIPDRLKEKE
jgi:hypothetical protein